MFIFVLIEGLQSLGIVTFKVFFIFNKNMFIFQEFVTELIKSYTVGGRYQVAFNIRK